MKYEVEVVITVEADDDVIAWDMVESQLEAIYTNENIEMLGVKDTPPPEPTVGLLCPGRPDVVVREGADTHLWIDWNTGQ